MSAKHKIENVRSLTSYDSIVRIVKSDTDLGGEKAEAVQGGSGDKPDAVNLTNPAKQALQIQLQAKTCCCNNWHYGYRAGS